MAETLNFFINFFLCLLISVVFIITTKYFCSFHYNYLLLKDMATIFHDTPSLDRIVQFIDRDKIEHVIANQIRGIIF